MRIIQTNPKGILVDVKIFTEKMKKKITGRNNKIGRKGKKKQKKEKKTENEIHKERDSSERNIEGEKQKEER